MKYKIFIRRADTGHALDILIEESSSKAAAERKGAKVAKALHSSGDYQIYAQALGRKRK